MKYTTRDLLRKAVLRKDGKIIADAWIEAAVPPEFRSNWRTWANIDESADPDPEVVRKFLLENVLKTIEKGFLQHIRRTFTLRSVHERVLIRKASELPGSVGVKVSSWAGVAEPIRPAPALVREQPASTGEKIAVGEEPVLTLKALDDRRRRQDAVHKLLPNLAQEIEEAWTAKRQGATREEIRERFRHSRSLSRRNSTTY